jgi:dihydropteroate synthase
MSDHHNTPPPTRIGGRLFEWGTRTFVMGIVNATPDSFSGDGLLAAARRAGIEADEAGTPAELAVAQARLMVAEGADMIDVGGESTRPGHEPVSLDEELARVVPIIAAIHAALPDIPISIDSYKPRVAAAALDAGASLLNDIWAVSGDSAMSHLAAERHVPLVVMHNRHEPVYADFMAEVVSDLRGALERAEALGVPAGDLIVDPGFGFGKTPAHNLHVLRELRLLRELGRPILLGTSRKSTLGRVLGGLPPEDRVEATIATTALGILGGADIIRVHDVEGNARAARMSDAVVRGWTE